MLSAAACFALLFGAGQAALALDTKCPDGSEPKAFTLDRKPVCDSGKSGPAANDDSRFAQHSIKIGTVTYKLPDNYVFINTKCEDSDAACKKKASDFLAKYQDSKGNSYSFLSNQNWLQCLSDCPDGSVSSGIDLDYCLQSPSCLKGIEKTMAAAQTSASQSADPTNAADKGIETGDKEAASYLNGGDTGIQPFSMLGNRGPRSSSGGRTSIGSDSPGVSSPGGTMRDSSGKVVSDNGGIGSLTGGGSKGTLGGRVDTGGSTDGSKDGSNASLTLARGGLSDNQDGQDPWLIGGIVDSSPFLKDRMFLASNTSATDLRAMQRVGANILNPISQQIMGDKTTGRSAFDGAPIDQKEGSITPPKDCLFGKCARSSR